MAENSKIEWTDHTFNPWRGCTKLSDGCKFCYAETLSKRNHATLGIWGPKGTRVVASESQWRLPLKWNAEAERNGTRPRVFCASLADVFEMADTMPVSSFPAVEEARKRLFALIEETPNLDWLLLTKRPENWQLCVPTGWQDGFPPNVWLGTSVENQAAADERIPHLLRCPAAVRFLSCEPLLGAVELDGGPYDWRGWLSGWHWEPAHDPRCDGSCAVGCPVPVQEENESLDWIIVGGESGPNHRPMDLAWLESIVAQCDSAGVPVFVKQDSGPRSGMQGRIPPHLWARKEFPRT